MTAIRAVVKDRRVELNAPPDWPDDTVVEIQPVPAVPRPTDRASWLRFIERTAGSITDPTFERQPQGTLEEREPLA